ncbi:MAG TPA: amidohydrolase family protein, partial [Vicinamibacterales bacterium]|nr:amidohydrolase family protein [Vicinamibacterales bacterium]
MTRRRSSGAIGAMLCVAAGVFQILHMPAAAQGSAPDLLFTNGKIVTVDERFTIAQAIAVKGDRIVAVGSSQEIAKLAGPGTRTVDLRGRTAIPGLIDNHLHLLRAGNTWELELRFDGIYSRKQAVEMLRERAKTVGAAGWVFNIGGWATAQFADDRKPFTREELDAIAPDNPVALQESYYQVFLNSRALKEFGIEAGKPDPPDFVPGSIQRDAAGKPTGIIRGDIAATRPVAARMPKLAPERLEASTLQLVQDVNRAGLTSFGVAGCDAGVLEIMQRWKSQGRLPVRIFCIGGAAAGSPEQVERS